MRILFLGDIVGRSGRDGVMAALPALRADLSPDVVIVNGENAASGHGITLKIAAELFEAGVDCLTSGNHIFRQRELIGAIGQEPRLLRPLNFPKKTPGRGFFLHSLPDGRKILIVNVMGQSFIEPILDNPFAALDDLLAAYPLGQTVQAIFVDFHAEATAEKVAFGRVFDGRVSAVIGTHTHVPTADEHLLTRGTAYQTDAGMCGDYDGVLGIEEDQPIFRFVRRMPSDRFVAAKGPATVSGCLIETDDKTGLARRIVRVQRGGILTRA